MITFVHAHYAHFLVALWCRNAHPVLQKLTETTRRPPSSNPLKLSKAVDNRCAPCSTVWSAWMKSWCQRLRRWKYQSVPRFEVIETDSNWYHQNCSRSIVPKFEQEIDLRCCSHYLPWSFWFLSVSLEFAKLILFSVTSCYVHVDDFW